MSALANGTYFISSILGGGERFYLGFGSGATREALTINTFTGLESHQWDVETSTIPNFYTFRNRRYQTYVTFSPPLESGTRVISSSDPRNWFVTSADSGYVIGIDQSASLVWNVNEGSEADGTLIILYPFQKTANEFWKLDPVQGTPSSTSSSATSSSTTSSTSAPSATCSCPAKEGMDLGDKIGLAVGLGVGIPTLLVAIVALFKDSPLAKYVKGTPSADSKIGYRQIS
ncbi:hypothetical protein MD484_g7040, partial [Candolleomyces efflorescens]